MLREFKDLSPIRKEVEVEIPADAVKARMGEVTSEFARQARVPGFRPGKAPKTVILKRFRKDIEGEVIDRLLPHYFSEAVRDRDVRPIGDPVLKKVDELVEGEPLAFIAEFEIKPTFELSEYRGIPVTELPVDVTPAEIDEVIERVRNQASSLKPVLEDRGAKDGDVVTVDIVASGEGVEQRSTEGYDMQLGENAPLPELNEALFGRRPGETTSFEKVYDQENAPNDEVRGKTVHYEVKLSSIREIEKPEVNDELAKSVGFESAEQMRARIEEDLKAHKGQDALQAKRRDAGRHLNERHSFDVPEVMIEAELGKALRDYARYLASQGVDLDKAQIDWEKVREEFQPEALERAKRTLILDAIAEKEEVTVSDTEVDAEIRKSADSGELAEVKMRLRQDGTYEQLRQAIREEKALALVVDAATPHPPEPAPTESK